MAENKKKTAAKKAAGKSNAASKNKKSTEQDVRYKNQMRAVILFAVALFLGCLVIIKGESLWQLGHNFLLGFLAFGPFFGRRCFSILRLFFRLKRPTLILMRAWAW
jgi:hypothetical protein